MRLRARFTVFDMWADQYHSSLLRCWIRNDNGWTVLHDADWGGFLSGKIRQKNGGTGHGLGGIGGNAQQRAICVPNYNIVLLVLLFLFLKLWYFVVRLEKRVLNLG